MLKDKKINITFTKDAKDFLVNLGFSEEYGAREVKRVLSDHVYSPITDMILEGIINKKDSHFGLLGCNKFRRNFICY